MNNNRRIKTAAAVLSASVIIGSQATVLASSPFGGALTTMMAYDSNVYQNTTVTSGATAAMTQMLSEAKTGSAPVGVAIKNGEVIVTHVVSENADGGTEVIATVEDNQESGEFSNIAIAQVNDYVNVRSMPSEDGEVVGKLYSNGAATVQGVEGEWVHITSGNCEGYIKGEFLTIGNDEVCLANSKIVASVNTDGLNVREETNTESAILSRMETGDRLTVVDTMDDNAEWIKVSTGDKEGYVASEFVEVGRIYSSVAETKEEEAARLEKERKAEEAKKAKAAQGSGGGNGGSYSAPSGGGGSSVASFACQFVGNPYVYGGSSLTGGADCSGFVMAVYSNFGVGLPHSSSALRGVGYEVGVDGMQPGDIVCYSGHVGIAIGGGQIVHASTPSSGIKISSAYYKNILAVRRIM